MQDPVSQALIAAAQGWNGEPPGEELKNANRAFFTRLKSDESLLIRLMGSLGAVDRGAAAWIAIASGTAVERGASAELTADAVVSLVRSWLTELPVIDPESETAPEPSAAQAALLELLPYLCQAAVSHLARAPARRAALGRDTQLIERLDELAGYSHGAIWLREALLKSSGTLMLLHPTSGKGLRLRYSNVSNCFHLFSLLQQAVGTRLEGGRASGAETTEAWWHYGNPHSKKPDLRSSIWGEGLTREIPFIDEVQVMLAWPPILASRVWDAGFLTPHLEALPADVVVEAELTAAESAQWLERLGVPKPGKKWWRLRFGSRRNS